MTRKHTNNRMQKKPKDFRLKHGDQKHNEKAEIKEIRPHSRQTSTRNEQMPTKSIRTRMDDQRKDHIDPKGSKQRNRSKLLQTHYLPTDDVENINRSTMGRDLLLANKPRIVPWGTEMMLPRIQRHRRVTLHRSAHPKREQDQTEKSSFGLDWLQKGHAKLDNNLPQNVQNITWSNKLYRENHENLEDGIDSGREKLSRSKDPKEIYFKEMHYNLIIHNCDTQKIDNRIQT